MKAIKTVTAILCFILFLFTISLAKGVEEKSWINTNYLKCMQNNLPCQCEKETKTYFVLVIKNYRNGGIYHVQGLKYDINEFDDFVVREKKTNEFELFEEDNKQDKAGNIIINGDSLYLYDIDNKKTVFVSIDSINVEESYQKINVYLLDSHLMRRGLSKLEDILKQDSLSCDCNKELEKVNLIFTEGRPKAWILEQQKNSIEIYDYLNISEGKTEPPTILRKLKEVYEW